MSRLQDKCIGDCSNCELLSKGEVDMIPCVLDQIFQHLQRLENRESKEVFVSIEQEKQKDYVQKDD